MELPFYPLWFNYSNTYIIDHPFFFGDSVLVSPVTDDDATSLSVYLSQDTFYEFVTLAPVLGAASNINLGHVNPMQILLHIKVELSCLFVLNRQCRRGREEE